MEIKKTNAQVLNAKPGKEGNEDELEMVSTITLKFISKRALFDNLVGSRKSVSEQFFTKDEQDVRLVELFPIVFHQKIEGLRLIVHTGAQPLKFEPCKVMSGAKFTPIPGGYMDVEAKFKVYPTPTQSGKLDQLVKLWVEIEIEELTQDGVGDE